MGDVALGLIRLASAFIFAMAAWLCWHRFKETHRSTWQVVGVVATVLAVYRLAVFIIFSLVGGDLASDLASASTVAANLAFVAMGVAAVYAAARTEP